MLLLLVVVVEVVVNDRASSPSHSPSRLHFLTIIIIIITLSLWLLSLLSWLLLLLLLSLITRGWGRLPRRASSCSLVPSPVRAKASLSILGTHYTADLRTKILDIGGFDSKVILQLRGDIFMSIGDSPENMSQRILAGRILVGRLGVHCAWIREPFLVWILQHIAIITNSYYH